MFRLPRRLIVSIGACAVLSLVAHEQAGHVIAGTGWGCWPWCCSSCEPQTPEERMARAGCPDCISRIAHISEEPADCGYYVGGGAGCCRGEQRFDNEGTWGWDYAPWYSHVRLGWYHGGRYQGGEGQYQQNRCNNPLRDLYRH
jgi:hypothetical protein